MGTITLTRDDIDTTFAQLMADAGFDPQSHTALSGNERCDAGDSVPADLVDTKVLVVPNAHNG